jgi:hypothetical protein
MKQGYAWWYFFPNPGNQCWGEVSWWNDLSDLDYMIGFVRDHQLGGICSWVARPREWRVHKHVNKALRAA